MIPAVQDMAVPRHIAIIMDGNGRWAKKRGLSRIFGHRAGVKAAEEIIAAADDAGIEVLTLYAFSTENWNRPASEVTALFSILKYFIRKNLKLLLKNNIRMKAIGDISGLPSGVVKEIALAVEKTSGNTGMVLSVALNYGGRNEIIRAVNLALSEGKKKLDGPSFEGYLYTAGLPDPDLVIRTSGEYRISNFLLWQSAYSELYITETLWPDFGKKEFLKALAEYKKRERRFGGVKGA